MMLTPLVALFAFPVVPSDFDAALIRRCVQLARQACGQTRPNPPVGCVLVNHAGQTIGEGYHHRAGSPHAEVNALTDAAQRGHSSRGATAYVSLEPCNHFGRTPPCSRTLVEAGVSRVVIGMVDPDPRTGGNGIQTLRHAGIDVSVGIEEPLCRQLTEGFVSRVVNKRPFGLLKWAMTLDGKIASESGSSRWVTGAAARHRVHEIRSEMDAIIVGGATVRADDPRLTVRGVDRHGPLAPIRVVMTRSLNFPTDRALWDVSEAETVVFTSSLTGQEHHAQTLRDRGVEVCYDPQLTPDTVMKYLYDRDCLSALWECGGHLAAQAISAGAVQKVHAFVAPKIIGGSAAPSPVSSPPVDLDMRNALQLSNCSVETFENNDVLITGYIPGHSAN